MKTRAWMIFGRILVLVAVLFGVLAVREIDQIVASLGVDPIFPGQPTPSWIELALYTAATGICAWSGQKILGSATDDS